MQAEDGLESAVKAAAPAYQEHFFSARDGLRLFYRRWRVPEAQGCLAVVHGFGEHSGRYDSLAADLNRAGWSVATVDYRGHGQSGGRRAHVDRFDEYLNDVTDFLDEMARDGLPDLPVLLGHSQGGLIAARFAELSGERVAALILSSPFLGLAMKVPAPKIWLGRIASRYLPTVSMPTGLDPAWLSHDPSIVEAYAADPLVSHHATARWFTEVTRAQDETCTDAGRLKLPLLVMQAGQDRIVSAEVSQDFFGAVGSANKHFEMYPEMFHEIFNEVDRGRVISDLTGWLERLG